MLDPRNATDLLLLVDAVIDGGITAGDAAHGTPPQIQTLFEIAEHLGNLGRGASRRLHIRPGGDAARSH